MHQSITQKFGKKKLNNTEANIFVSVEIIMLIRKQEHVIYSTVLLIALTSLSNTRGKFAL